MHFYSIHVIVEYNLSGSEIICRQILVLCVYIEQEHLHNCPLYMFSFRMFNAVHSSQM